MTTEIVAVFTSTKPVIFPLTVKLHKRKGTGIEIKWYKIEYE